MLPITVLGIGLSALAFVGVVGLLVDCLRRRPFRVLGVSLEGWRAGVARAVASIALLAGFVLGLAGLPVVSSSEEIGGTGIAAAARRPQLPARGQVAAPAAAVSTSWRFPFYAERSTRVISSDGDTLGGSVGRTLQLPWVFLCSVAAYWITFARDPRQRPPARESARTGP